MCSQTGPNLKNPLATHTKTSQHPPKCLFPSEKGFFQCECRQQHVFSTSQLRVKFCYYTLNTVEKQGNNLQHPGLLRMTDGGIKGGGMGRRSSTASTAPHERRRGGCNSFPLSTKIKRHSMLKSKHLLDNLRDTASASGSMYVFHPAL